MKTNILLLTLIASASLVHAAKPVAPVVKSSPMVPRNLGIHPQAPVHNVSTPKLSGPTTNNPTSVRINPGKPSAMPKPVAAPSSVPMVKPGPAVPTNIGNRSLPVNASNQVPLKPSFTNKSANTVRPQLPTRSSNTVVQNRQSFNSATKLSRTTVGNHGFTSDPRVAGFTGKNGAGMIAGLDTIAALKDIDSIRNAVPKGAEGFGIEGNMPQRQGFDVPNFSDEGSFNNNGSGSQTPHNPLDRFANAKGKPTDIRGMMNGSTQGKGSDGPQTGSAGDSRSHGVHSGGWTGVTSRSTSSDGSSVETITAMQGPNGSSETYREKRTDTDGDGDAETLESREVESVGSDGTVERQETHRNSDGTYTTEHTRTAPGEVPSSEHTTTAEPPEAQSLDHISTSGGVHGFDAPEGASSPGSGGPSVKQVTGLTNLDLLRQVAEGQPSGTRSGGYFVNGGARAVNQINPTGANGTTTGPASTIKIDTLHPTGRGGIGTGGGDQPQ